MASESTQDIDRSNEATVTTETEPTIKIDSDSAQDVDSGQAHVNGDAASTAAGDEIDNKAISDIVDDLVNSAEVSISGGSDTEASRSSKLKDEDKQHGRTSSTVRKPISFKAVSVNKTFLAAKGATSNTPAKTGDKSPIISGLAPASGSSSAATARPRLVAKTGSGLVAKSAMNGDKRSAPDPNAVWNKNRPAPPPEPKKFTDEELKKYGIHMASRLQSDAGDSKGHANWADIDDDDDDGDYLETITWKDGTKITIPHPEEQPPTPATAPTPAAPTPPPTQSLVAAPQVVAKETTVVEKPKSPAPGPPPVRGLPSGKGLVLHKGAVEKPTLVAKPPAPPTPAKSPWAPIPKVEKASPIVPDLPAPQHGGSRFMGKEASAARGMTPPPPKEIAPDDFHRSPWGQGPGAPNRELYNAHSGRYEPVQDRRGSAYRHDQHPRQGPAAVLQRGAVVHETTGPAEPSSAFQTSRISDAHVPFGRRRGSSNVSGGSGAMFRHQQPPFGPPEIMGARRESFNAPNDHPAPSINILSPAGQGSAQYQQAGPHPHNNHNWQQQPPHLSPALASSVPHHSQPPTTFHQQTQHSHDPAAMEIPNPSQPAGPQPPVQAAAHIVTEQDIELQKRLMQERRELAMKRRLEQEAKEEAERRERIRIKLEALGPPPESRSSKQIAKRDDGAQVPASTPAAGSQSQQSQGTVTTTGAPQSVTDELKKQDQAPVRSQPEVQLHPQHPTDRSTRKPDPLPRGLPPAQHQPGGLPSQEDSESRESRSRSQGHAHGHPHPSWPTSTSQPQQDNRYGTWNARQLSNSNVWGSPNNDRSLGNGTFNPDLSRLPDGPLAAGAPPSKHDPGPIAPPSGGRLPTAPAARPAPIAPPNRQLPFQRSEQPSRNVQVNSWTEAIRAKDAAMSQELMARRDAQEQELRARGLDPSEVTAPIKDTWRPTKLTDDGRRKTEKMQQSYHATKAPGWGSAPEQPVSPSELQSLAGYPQAQLPPQSVISSSVDPSSDAILHSTVAVAPHPRSSSRFFPSPRDVRHEAAAVSDYHHRSSSPSPPPPDMVGHPAFDGDVARPHVHLPPAKPRVCLPPAPTPAAGPQHPAFGWANPTPYKESESATTHAVPRQGQRRLSHETATTGSWQRRFDTLLHQGRTPLSPPRPSVPVIPASRSSLEHPQYTRSATVSLPIVGRGLFKNLPPDNDGSPTSKDMAEDCFEEQEMGSVPPVRLPKQAPQSAWHPYPAPKPLVRKLMVTSTSRDIPRFDPDMTGTGMGLRLSFPGMTETKNITIPFSRTPSNPRSRRGGRHSSQTQRGGKGRDREASRSYSNDQSSAPPSSGSSSRGRGGYRSQRDYVPRHQGTAAIST